MNPSLSVLVPIFNAQSTLGTTVEELLEILPELTSRFEVILVDDASTDATVDAAQELAVRFPQVQVLLQPSRSGPQEALRSALRYSHGELVLLCSSRGDFDLHDIRKLWDRHSVDGAVFAVVAARSPLGSIPPLPKNLTSPNETPTPDLLLAPRRILSTWYAAADRQPVVFHLRKRGFKVEQVEIRSRSRETMKGRPDAAVRMPATTRPILATEHRLEPAAALAKSRPRLNPTLMKYKPSARGQ